MRRWWILKLPLLLVALLSALTSAAVPQTRGLPLVLGDSSGERVELYTGGSFALLIGASHYQHWPSLPGVAADLKAVRAALEGHGFQVTVVEDPDRQALRQAYEEFINAHGNGVENRLLFYFAGHGETLKRAWGGEMGYIVPIDAPRPDADERGFLAAALTMEQFQVYARSIQSKHALFLFDSCFSGSLFNLSRGIPAHISKKTAEPVRQFITSGSAREKVPDDSIFRRQLVDGLAGEADQNPRDGYVTGTELGEFLKARVAGYSRGAQNPQSGTIQDPLLDRGDFVFTLSGLPPPRSPASGGLERMPQMVPIRGGCFQMGSPAGFLGIGGEADRQDDEHRHPVCVKDFSIGKYEVTRRDFRRFVEATGHRTDAERGAEGLEGCYTESPKFIGARDYHHDRDWGDPGHSQAGDHPVVCVSWNDAQAYIEWLNRASGGHYRLPTEAEWEYAARGGTRTARFWGNSRDAACGYANVGDRSAQRRYHDATIHDCDDGVVFTSPVGRYRPNPYGLHDMLGNVWEWTCSAYDAGYGGAERECVDPGHPGPLVRRGGSWNSTPWDVRAAQRKKDLPLTRRDDLGFRLAHD